MTEPYSLRRDRRAVVDVALELEQLADGFPATQATERAEELLDRVQALLELDGRIIGWPQEVRLESVDTFPPIFASVIADRVSKPWSSPPELAADVLEDLDAALLRNGYVIAKRAAVPEPALAGATIPPVNLTSDAILRTRVRAALATADDGLVAGDESGRAALALAAVDLELNARGWVLATRDALAGLEAKPPAPPSPAVVGGAVRFRDVDPFAAELERDRDHVDRRIVRATFRARPLISGVPTPSLLILEGAAIVAGRFVRLELPIGELWGMGPDGDVRRKGRELVEALQQRLEAAGLELREGVLEA